MFDPSISYGYIMCDINGLKVANDTMGHEAGDELIKGVAACLSDVFGDENVYRIGGDEFVAISYASDKVAFDNEVSKLKRLIKAADKSASLGCVYSENGEHGFEEAMEMADKLMYEAKEEFYKTRDRRNS
jgi:diguanylate cyclase (GGDEF)-like protein